jgi:hypothetical protein
MNETAPTLNTVFRVFDIPLELSAAATEKILNIECGDDRYISAVAPIPGALRVVARVKAANLKPADEDRAIELVRAHSDWSCNRTVALLKQHGIRRNTNWVSQQHYDIEAERNAASSHRRTPQ